MPADPAQGCPSVGPGPRTRARVWDLPLRLFHWTLLPCLVLLWWSGTEGGAEMTLHLLLGKTVLILLLFRLCWGFTGSHHGRFNSFIRGPRTLLSYTRKLLKPDMRRYRGHNPLGGWMVAAMLLALCWQVATGLFANDDLSAEGPLMHWIGKEISDQVTSLHRLGFRAILLLTGLHILGVLFHDLVRGEGLTRAMISGYKNGFDERPSPYRPRWTAVAPAVAIFALVTFLW